ncbi:hypothetical protein D9M71_732550 [compost metagenome]
MAQFSKQFPLQLFHFFRFCVFDMVVAEQMQAAVDDQVRPVRRQRLGLLRRLAGDHRGADHQIAEQRDVQQFVRHIGGEGQYVGGVVLVPPGAV